MTVILDSLPNTITLWGDSPLKPNPSLPPLRWLRKEMKTERLARKTKMIYLQCFQTPNTCKTSKCTTVYSRLPKTLNFQTDTNLSDIRFLSQISLITKWLLLLNNIEPLSWIWIHNKLQIFSSTNVLLSRLQKLLKWMTYSTWKSVQFSLKMFSKYVYFL